MLIEQMVHYAVARRDALPAEAEHYRRRKDGAGNGSGSVSRLPAAVGRRLAVWGGELARRAGEVESRVGRRYSRVGRTL